MLKIYIFHYETRGPFFDFFRLFKSWERKIDGLFFQKKADSFNRTVNPKPIAPVRWPLDGFQDTLSSYEAQLELRK